MGRFDQLLGLLSQEMPEIRIGMHLSRAVVDIFRQTWVWMPWRETPHRKRNHLPVSEISARTSTSKAWRDTWGTGNLEMEGNPLFFSILLIKKKRVVVFIVIFFPIA